MDKYVDRTDSCYVEDIVEAQLKLGDLYSIGAKVEQNWHEATRWYIQAAELGATAALGALHRIADQGELSAQYYIAGAYAAGKKGFKLNPVEAAVWYLKAAQQGHSDAQNKMGDHYRDGAGVEQSDTEAAKFYDMAVAQRNSYAKKSLICLIRNSA